MRPGLEKITRMWGRKAHGYELGMVSAASSGRHMRTGQMPQRVYTKRSVAERRLKKGDPVGCMVRQSGKEAYALLEHRMVRGRPEMRPFVGLGAQGKGAVDRRGKVTFHLSQPGVLLPLLAHYEEYYGLVQGGSMGGGSTGAKKGIGAQQRSKAGRYRSRETGATSLAVGRARREGRRRPRGS